LVLAPQITARPRRDPTSAVLTPTTAVHTQVWAPVSLAPLVAGPREDSHHRHDERPDLQSARPDRRGARARGQAERRGARGQARGDPRLVPPALCPPSSGLLRAAMPDPLDSRTAG